MKAARIETFGDPPVLAEIESPSPGAGQVLVRIAACGLNFADLLMIDGKYQDTPQPPFTLGMEIAGIVEGHGQGVALPAIGTRVAVFAGSGGLAEYGAFDAARCVPIPDAMSFEEAAGFLVAYGTSHLALTRRARLREGERLLDARTADIRAKVKALGGADVVYDAVGGAMFADAMRATNPEGRIIVIGFASGTLPQIAPNHLLVKNIDVVGFYWGGYMRFGAEHLAASLKALMEMYEAGRIQPHIGATRPLDRFTEALDLLRARAVAGKVVVTMDE